MMCIVPAHAQESHNYRWYVYRTAFYANEDESHSDSGNFAQTNSKMKINKATENVLLQKEDSTGSDMYYKPQDLRTVKPKKKPCDNVVAEDDKKKGMDMSSNDNRRSSIGKSRIQKLLGPTDTIQRSQHRVKPVSDEQLFGQTDTLQRSQHHVKSVSDEQLFGQTDTLPRSQHCVKPVSDEQVFGQTDTLQTSQHRVKSLSDEQLFGQTNTLQRSQHRVKSVSDEQLFGQTDTLQRSQHRVKPMSDEQLFGQTDTLPRSQHCVKPLLDHLQSETKCKFNFSSFLYCQCYLYVYPLCGNL